MADPKLYKDASDAIAEFRLSRFVWDKEEPVRYVIVRGRGIGGGYLVSVTMADCNTGLTIHCPTVDVMLSLFQHISLAQDPEAGALPPGCEVFDATVLR